MVPTTFIGKLITFPAMMFGVLVKKKKCDKKELDPCTKTKIAYCFAINYCWSKFHNCVGEYA